MSDVLFVTLDAGGNLPPALSIGSELLRRGHRVRMLGHEPQRRAVEAAGLQFIPYRHSPPWDPTAQKTTATGLRRLIGVMTDRGIGADLLDAVRAERADIVVIVVIDCMLLNALDAASRAGLRHAALFHTFYAYFDGSWRHGPIGIVGRMKGMGAQRLWRQADLALVCSERELDPARNRTGVDYLAWTGAIQDATQSAIAPERPRVLASLSTTNFPGQDAVLQNILDAVDGMDLDLTMTTGPAADPSKFVAPSNATVQQYVPHNELMPTCSAVIGHGGHATTFRALGHGLPMLVLPMHPMLDQPMVGKTIAAAGAGITLPKKSTPEAIRTALTQLLGTSSYRERAIVLGNRLRANDATAMAADRLAALMSLPLT
ncbi:glycosyltransferase [Antrihabitans cavernicola]|uniref:Glycosyltransferase family 1 protein n=1 Tax=Antrihabitans cavernicola TaxID=2495913 RepID=A0A5A7S7X6_9NOCA|nr:glycosyltransferase [Spelaeibacter cavernicola]KAA0022016.1 glycosyltransferase family 1 protein [Spelaeibacter cavernicola]